MPPQARIALAEWLKIREKMTTTHNYLFVQANKNRQPLGKRSIENIVKQTGYRVKMELTPQILRHTAVGFWREEMGDAFAAIQLGISFDTMWRYPCMEY